MTRLHELTASEARAALTRGDFSCTDYVRALLERTDAAASLNALVAQDQGRPCRRGRRGRPQRRRPRRALGRCTASRSR